MLNHEHGSGHVPQLACHPGNGASVQDQSQRESGTSHAVRAAPRVPDPEATDCTCALLDSRDTMSTSHRVAECFADYHPLYVHDRDFYPMHWWSANARTLNAVRTPPRTLLLAVSFETCMCDRG